MAKTEFTKFEKARIKRTAQNVDQCVTQKNKLAEKIARLQAEYDEKVQMIDLYDAPIKLMTGGYGVETLVKKVITPTDKLDKNGNVIKTTSYEFLYPETIIPVQQEEEHTEPIGPPTTEGMAGSDFDVDTEVSINGDVTEFTKFN